MSETKNLEIVETAEAAIPEKPYTFRLLGAPDIFLMSKIISKIGIKECKTCFESDGIKSLIQNAMVDKAQKDGNDTDDGNDTNIISAGAEVALELASVILTNLPKCENDIYQMLSQTSNLSVEEIKAPGNAAMFLEMVIDFIKKEEFRDFFKVVSKLF